MKTFDDLQFRIHSLGIGKRAIMDFDNGWGVSVVMSPLSYGGIVGLYELAVIKGDNIHYDNPVANGDVRGRLSKNMVTELMSQVQRFTNGSELSDYSNE
jgi:hypothetical protein